jgi:aromatic-L-amino-acid/L-tryptophan decarboxylase
MRTLALNDRERAAADRLLAELLDGYERAIPAPRIVPEVDREALSALLDTPFPEQGVGVERLFAEIESSIVTNSTAIAHPRFLAYVQGPPNGIALTRRRSRRRSTRTAVSGSCRRRRA